MTKNNKKVEETEELKAPELTEVERLQINLEYATRLLWLVVSDLGGEVVVSKESIEAATFDEVRVTDTVDGGLHVQAVKN
jgi:hypothetical protein